MGKGYHVDDLPLDRHAVLEASAGTGKTYALERLVIRLLTDGHADLDKILVVTFGEKATGELRGRLRKALVRAAAAAGDKRGRLEKALAQFDQAPIFTIHGFCQKVLQEHAFEHGHDFQTQLVDDRELLPGMLRRIQRAWPTEYGADLRTILEASGYDAAWEETVLEIAERFRPACDHRLLPESVDHWQNAISAFDQEVCAARERLRGLLGALSPSSASGHPLLRAYTRLSKFGTHQNRGKAMLLPALAWLADPDGDARPTAVFCKLLHRCSEDEEFRDVGFRALTAKLRGVSMPAPLTATIEALEALRTAAAAAVPPHQLAVRTIHRLQAALDQHKRTRGLLSFEDMLARVGEGLDLARNPGATELIAHLRHRFHYAIVDEFQDTDPLQWRILRRLFVESGTSRLFVVGDPKQAIFNFRGADLATYQVASKELKDRPDTSPCTLDTNWRSSAELIEALNRLFEHGGWFRAPLAFEPVKSVSDASQRSAFVDVEPERAALTIVRLHGAERQTQARALFACFCADEIARLLTTAPCIKDRESTRPLQPRDVCVLVQRRSEVAPLIDELTKRKIPFSFYKQDGLWQSKEAQQIAHLLAALARPEEPRSFARALLTRFFRVAAPELAACEDLPARHPARVLFQGWAEDAETRRWAQLFGSMLHDSGMFHHELIGERDGERPLDGERRLANYRHILRALEQEAYGRGLDLLGVLDLIHVRRAKRADFDAANYQPIETERDKVKIMTLHASKGLEFPVVFLAGGFTESPEKGVRAYRDETGRVVFDLADGACGNADAERDAELRRVFYVGLTRGMVRVYVPWIGAAKGTPGALGTIVAPALEQSGVAQLGGQIAHVLDYAPPADAAPAALVPKPRVAATLSDPAVVFPRLDADLSSRRIVVRSFSSLHRKLMLRAADAPTFGEGAERADDDVPEALEDMDALRGPVFGDMVHAVLEQVDFAAVGRAASPEELLKPGGPLEASLEEHLSWNLLRLRTRAPVADLAQLCREQVARLVWAALHTPLLALGGPLWQVPAEERLHELEFHFPSTTDGSPPPETQREEGFLTGIMDLVVRRGGRFFLVDWKTNYLADYSPADLQQAMADCDYVRQYRLYLQALERWLRRLRGKGFAREREFGGVYYLFLRGLNGRDETSGVFAARPTDEDFELARVLAEEGAPL